MIDIKDKLLDVMRADPQLMALLGGTPQDPRLYAYYQGKASISADKPAYLTYSNISTPEASMAVEMPVFSYMVWAKTWTRAEAVGARLRALFHKQLYVTEPGRKLYTKVVSESDSFQEQPDFTGRTLQVRVCWSTV